MNISVGSDLQVRKQCISVRNEANSVSGFINKIVINKSLQVILKLSLALVRSPLDYGVEFLSSSHRMDINLLESVQRRMTKMIQGLRNLSYQDRLKHIKKLQSLRKVTSAGRHD